MSSLSGPAPVSDPATLQLRLNRTQRLLALNERLVAGLIHDLRTPLMAINLSAEVALARSNEDAVQQAARRIRTSSERMSRIFDHLLNLSRVTDSVPDLELKPADLNGPLEAVLAEIGARDRQATFALTREGDLRGVFDPALLRRTLANVVGTALPHAGDARTVTIHVDGSHRDRLWLRVTVPGVIPAEVQEGMFVPGPNVRGLEVPGLGLGLHEIDAFVRDHGGSIVGRSRAPHGTVFELLLPRDASAAS
jgi:two-component system sensor histidine kinase/response regulator